MEDTAIIPTKSLQVVVVMMDVDMVEVDKELKSYPVIKSHQGLETYLAIEVREGVKKNCKKAVKLIAWVQIFGKFLDFRKIFRFSENFQICGKFSDF